MDSLNKTKNDVAGTCPDSRSVADSDCHCVPGSWTPSDRADYDKSGGLSSTLAAARGIDFQSCRADVVAKARRRSGAVSGHHPIQRSPIESLLFAPASL